MMTGDRQAGFPLLSEEMQRSEDPGYLRRRCAACFSCPPDAIRNVRLLQGGFMNRSYLLDYEGETCVFRMPGEGTEELVDRKREAKALRAASQLGFDPTFLYMDPGEGWKISRYVADVRLPDYADPGDRKLLAETLRKLHSVKPSGRVTANGSLSTSSDRGAEDTQRAGEDAGRHVQLPRELPSGPDFNRDTERFIRILDREAPGRAEELHLLYEKIVYLADKDPIRGLRAFCHGDFYRPNLLVTAENELILIDWEYAGIGDPAVDVGYLIADAGWLYEEAEAFIRSYLGEAVTEYCSRSCPDRDEAEPLHRHFLIGTARIAFYWVLWAELRKLQGRDPGDVRERWQKAAEYFAEICLNT